MDKPRIIFLGTPWFSASLLEYMLEKGFNIVGVISKEDKAVKRSKEALPSPVSAVAIKYNIPLHRPSKLNKDYQFIEDLNPDLLLTFAYGQIISTKVLALSKFPPLNVHASLLPKYRGSNPIQFALRNGDEKTGVCLMEMVKECDAGDVFAKEEVNVDDKDNLSSLTNKLLEASKLLIERNLNLFFENKLTRQVQNPLLISHTTMTSKEDEHLNLNFTCKEFHNFVRSLADDIGGYLNLENGEKLKIFETTIENNKVVAEVGVIIKQEKDKLLLQLKDGQINLVRLQKPGKKIMSTRDFNNGNKNFEKIKLY